MPANRWAVVDLAKTLTAKFRRDWRNTPAPDRRAWSWLMVAGAVAVITLLAICIVLLKSTLAGANHFSWEERVLLAIEAGPFTFGNAIWFQTFGADTTLAFVTLATAGIAVWYGRPLLAISIVLTPIMMDTIVRLGWLSFDRTRPTLIAEGVASPGYRSFPSGHTAKTLAFYGLLCAQWLQASRSRLEQLLVVLLLLVITAAVPLGRLRTGVHWPTDVLGGWLLGGTWLVFALCALRHERQREPSRP